MGFDLILASIYKAHDEPINELWNHFYGRPIFNQSMARNRFQSIMRLLRFDDVLNRRRNSTNDKFQPIRNIWQRWTQDLALYFNPNECITIDERLAPFRGRCAFRQYIPSKPNKYGLKIWIAADSQTSYILNAIPYLGKEDTRINLSVEESAVLNLVKELPIEGRNITTDNFFTSVSLL